MMTSPVTETEIVIGKFAASLFLFFVMLSLTFLCPLFLVIYGNVSIVPMAVGYLGLFLLGMAFLALGIAASTLTKSQMVAAVISFVILLGLWVIGWMSGAVGSQLGKILSFISLVNHFDDFSKGVLDTKHVIYYISFASFCLFFAVKMVQSAKWK